MQTVFYILWLILITILQPTLARGIDVLGIAPNFFLCFVILTGFFRGKMEGAVCGGVFGLVFDILIGRMIGVNSLCYLYLGFASGLLSERFFIGQKRMAAVLTAIAGTLLASIAYLIARMAAYGDIGFFTAVFRIGLPEAIYNGCICFVLSFPVSGMLKLMRIKKIS